MTWDTILRGRAGYREVFDRFDPRKAAGFTAKRKRQLLRDSGIICNGLKIEAVITNARAFSAVQEECVSFDRYVWRFASWELLINHWRRLSDIAAASPENDALLKDLKQCGFRFFGSAIIYVSMLVVGMFDDQTVGCGFRKIAGRQ